jgi:hypothetical protein
MRYQQIVAYCSKNANILPLIQFTTMDLSTFGAKPDAAKARFKIIHEFLHPKEPQQMILSTISA